METWSHLKLLVFRCLALVVICHCEDSVPYCPVVSKGSRFSMTCTVQAPNNKWFVIWEVTNLASGQSTEITRCGVDQKVCGTNSQIARFGVENSQEEAQITSTISLDSAQPEHHNLQLTCKSWVLGSANYTVYRRCKMAVYKQSESTVCSSKVLDDGGIHLQCINRFTTISCLYIESVNGILREIQSLGTKNRTQSGNSDLYMGSCSDVIYPLGPGNYRYHFIIHVALGNGGLLKDDFSGTALLLNPRPKVTVIQSPKKIPLCKDKSLATVGCQVSWLKAKPTFRFYLADKELKNLVVREIKYRNETESYSKFEALSEVEVTKKDNKLLMRCEVTFHNEKETVSLDDTKRLELTWPPREAPVFMSDSVVLFQLGNSLEIKKWENATLMCNSPRSGEPRENLMEINCRLKDTVLYNSSKSSSVSLTVSGQARFNYSRCECVMHHESNCYTSTAVIQIVVTPLGRQVNTQTAVKKADKMIPIYYIIAATLLLLLFPFVVAACCVVCRRPQDGDDYYYNYYGYGEGDRSYINLLRHMFSPPRPPAHGAPPIPPRPSNEPPPRPAPRIPPRPDYTSRSDPPPDRSRDLDSELWEDDETLTAVLQVRHHTITYNKKCDRQKHSKKTTPPTSDDSCHYIPMHPPRRKCSETVLEPLSLSSEAASVSKATSSSENSEANISESDYLLPKTIKKQSSSHQPSGTECLTLTSLGFEPPPPPPPRLSPSKPSLSGADIATCEGAGARSSVSSDRTTLSSSDGASITEVED